MDNFELVTAQSEVLGMYLNNTEMFRDTVLKEEHFDGIAKDVYRGIKLCFEEYNDVIVEYIVLMFEQHTDYVLSIYSNVSTVTNARLKHLENFIIQEYRKKKAQDLLEKYKSGTIDYSAFIKRLQDTEQVNADDVEQLTTETLMGTLKSQEKSLKLWAYPKLSGILKLCHNDFVVIGASTGGGKSAFALNLMNDLSDLYPCVYFNLEIAKEQVHNRLIAIESQAKIEEIERYDRVEPSTKTQIDNGVKRLGEKDIKIITKSVSLTDIRNILGSLDKEKHTIVFIDHLLLIKSNLKGRYEKVTDIAIQLRQVSLDYNVTIIALCQLNRESFKDNNPPELSALKESGEIENSASKVMFLYYDTNKQYWLSIAKNRTGKLARIRMLFNKDNQVIKEM
jgi:replicative DNA helicase